MKPRPIQPKLKIAFILDAWYPYVGGGQVYAKHLKAKLEEMYGCTILLYYPPSPHILVRLVWSLYIWIHIVYKHQHNPVDLFHSQGYNAGFVGKVCSLVTGIKVIHTVHGSNLTDQRVRGLKAWLERWLLTSIRYDALITVSSAFLKHHNNSRKTIFIPNGVDYGRFQSRRVHKTNFPSIIWIGRDDPVKDTATLKRVLALVQTKISEAKSTVILSGTHSPRQLSKLYQESWVYLQTSRSEGFSLTVLEAMAAGLPVVATAVGENPNLIKSGVNGYLSSPGAAEQLAKYVIKLIKDAKLRKKMGELNTNIIKDRYTWDRVAAKTYKAYLDLLLPPNTHKNMKGHA